VIEVLHGRFMTAEDVKRLDGYISKEIGRTSETHAFIMGLVVEKVDYLSCKELTGFANADLEFARGTFGNGNVAIVFRETDGEGFYVRDGKRKVEVLSTPTSFKEKANRRPSKTTAKPWKWVSSSCAQIRLKSVRWPLPTQKNEGGAKWERRHRDLI
jgi:hypothetical protein